MIIHHGCWVLFLLPHTLHIIHLVWSLYPHGCMRMQSLLWKSPGLHHSLIHLVSSTSLDCIKMPSWVIDTHCLGLFKWRPMTKSPSDASLRLCPCHSAMPGCARAERWWPRRAKYGPNSTEKETPAGFWMDLECSTNPMSCGLGLGVATYKMKTREAC